MEAALQKLAFVETLVNDKLLQEKSTMEVDTDFSMVNQRTLSTSISEDKMSMQRQRRGLDVSGPVKDYHPNLKNFWYPVAFSKDLKEDTMVRERDENSPLFGV